MAHNEPNPTQWERGHSWHLHFKKHYWDLLVPSDHQMCLVSMLEMSLRMGNIPIKSHNTKLSNKLSTSSLMLCLLWWMSYGLFTCNWGPLYPHANKISGKDTWDQYIGWPQEWWPCENTERAYSKHRSNILIQQRHDLCLSEVNLLTVMKL